MESYKLLVFNSTHHALKAESILKQQGNQIKTIPIPPEISADCGVAIKLVIDDSSALAILKQSKVEVADCYQVSEEGLEKRIKRLT